MKLKPFVLRDYLSFVAVMLVEVVFVMAIGSYYLPAGIALGGVVFAITGFAFDGLDEGEVDRTSPWLLPSVALLIISGLACLTMAADLVSRLLGG